jgi:hypothetical protein
MSTLHYHEEDHKRSDCASHDDVREALSFEPKAALTRSTAASIDRSTTVSRTVHTEPARLDSFEPSLSLREEPSQDRQEGEILEQTSSIEVEQQEEASAQSGLITDADVLNLSSFGVARDNCWVSGAPESFGVTREDMWVLGAPEHFGVERENQWFSETAEFYPDTTSLNLQ